MTTSCPSETTTTSTTTTTIAYAQQLKHIPLKTCLLSLQVFDDICTELTMAILQFFSSDSLPEEQVFRCLKALAKFASITREVGQLVAMIGPDPAKFRKMSSRVDALVEQVKARM